MRIFFSAGEASGDAYAAELAARCSIWASDLEGIVGRRGQEAGIRMVADNRRWGAIGIFESLRVAPRVLRGYRRAIRALRNGSPGLFVAIDFGFLNVKLCTRAKALGWKTLYFVPPGSWRRNKQGSDLPRIADEIVTPFEWSAKILRGMGASAHWFGHPLKQMARERAVRTEERSGVAILPGSRMHEIAYNLPVIAESLRDFEGPVILSRAPNVDADALRALWRGLSGADAQLEDDVYRTLSRARVAIVCSGTATLESVLCGCPLVVVYRGGKVMEFEARLRGVRPEHIALPNILLDRRAIPELIQREATPEAIGDWVRRLSEDSAERAAQLSAFEEIDALLGPSDCLDQTAALMRRMGEI